MKYKKPRLKIQPAQSHPAGVRPYPYWINPETGEVAHVTRAKQNPDRLMCFVNSPDSFEPYLTFAEFRDDPTKAEGLYPVFSHIDGSFHTYTTPCERTEQ